MLAFRLAVSHLFRPHRMRAFVDAFHIDATTRVLDIGGTPTVWMEMDEARRPRVTLVNLLPPPPVLPEGFEYVQGSALDLPFQPGDFDVVFSNSVIEHVGDWKAQQRFADEVRRLGCPFYVQTPYHYFPIEPHFLGVGVQFLPRPVARIYARFASLWGLSTGSLAAIDHMLDETRTLSMREMRALFPATPLLRERFLGLTKSIIAQDVRHGAASVRVRGQASPSGEPAPASPPEEPAGPDGRPPRPSPGRRPRKRANRSTAGIG